MESACILVTNQVGSGSSLSWKGLQRPLVFLMFCVHKRVTLNLSDAQSLYPPLCILNFLYKSRSQYHKKRKKVWFLQKIYKKDDAPIWIFGFFSRKAKKIKIFTL